MRWVLTALVSSDELNGDEDLEATHGREDFMRAELLEYASDRENVLNAKRYSTYPDYYGLFCFYRNS
jgi:hypothetical protein